MKRNKISLSHYRLLTGDMGKLLPVTWFEVLPGDSVQMATATFIRLSPLVAPVMHPVMVRLNHWFVPYRIIWDTFEDFITGGDDGTFVCTPPYFSLSAISESSLHNYLGVPPGSYSPNLSVSALAARAYTMIHNEHFRDEDLVDENVVDTTDGLDSTTNTDLLQVAWPKDYFTMARPFTQKGTEVTIPLQDAAPILGIGKNDQTFSGSSASFYESDGSQRQYASFAQIDPGTGSEQFYIEEDPNNAGYPYVRADLTAATGIPISDLRLALGLQSWQEARARYGSRYVEYLRYLGVPSSDARMQKPEYLGGGRQVIQFSEVLQTAEGTDPVGSMKGHGISAMRSNKYRRFFNEHGLVMTLMSVVPISIYTQQLHRKFFRTVKEDFFTRELQHIGDQEVYNKEVYAEHSAPDEVFGYQSRYDEYRSHPSGVAGEFHTTNAHWHMGRIHATDPALNNTFVECVPTKRIHANESDHTLYVMANNSIKVRRAIARRAR